MIQIKQTTIEDLDFILMAENHPENRPYIGNWSHDQHYNALSDPDIGHLLVVHHGKRVGYIIITGLTSKDQSVNLKRLVITEKKHGYGQKAIKLVIKMAFEKYQAHRFWLDVREKNSRAQHVYQKIGFKKEGLLRECSKVEGEWESLFIMSILLTEYKNEYENRY